jgi:hypothetical protein
VSVPWRRWCRLGGKKSVLQAPLVGRAAQWVGSGVLSKVQEQRPDGALLVKRVRVRFASMVVSMRCAGGVVGPAMQSLAADRSARPNPNQPLQPTVTRLQTGAARRAGSRQRLNGGVRWTKDHLA